MNYLLKQLIKDLENYDPEENEERLEHKEVCITGMC